MFLDVAMTIVTIVRQSSSNVESERQGRWCRWALREDRQGFGAIHGPCQPKTLTEEVRRQQGKRAENKGACVSVKEGAGGEKHQEVMVTSFKSLLDGVWIFTRAHKGDAKLNWGGDITEGRIFRFGKSGK